MSVVVIKVTAELMTVDCLFQMFQCFKCFNFHSNVSFAYMENALTFYFYKVCF